MADLQRNEVIALLNLLHRLSESVQLNKRMSAAIRDGIVTLADPEEESEYPHFLL